MNKFIIKALFVALTSLAFSAGSTNAFFTDYDATEFDSFTANWQINNAKIVLNEVYFLGNDEWIELYNAGDSEVDIKGWSICNAENDCGKLNPAHKTLLAPGSFVLVSHNQSNLKTWNLSKSIVRINYAGAKINFDDIGDAIFLRDSQNLIIDQMSYGDNLTAFDPACSVVEIRHSLERQPNGADTDTSADFVDQAKPTPGA